MITCPACNTENQPEAVTCSNCGTLLPIPASPPVAGTTAATPPPAPEPTVFSPSAMAPAVAQPPAMADMPGPGQPPPVYVYAQRPPKDRSIAIILELLPDLFGLFGIGWIYAGNTAAGIIWLVAVMGWNFIVIIVAAITGGLVCICTIPMNIVLTAISVYSLNEYTKKHPELFG